MAIRGDGNDRNVSRVEDRQLSLPLMEALEPRLMLNGLTLITHGYNGSVDDWVSSMAVAIGERAGGYDEVSAWTIGVTDEASPNVTYVNRDNGPDRWDHEFDGESIVKLDWSTISTCIGPMGTIVSTVEVATAVVDYLMTTSINGITWLDGAIHLIGHSRGGSLVGAIAAGLGENDIAVDHVTFLDPHPTANGFGSADDDWGESGMFVPTNVHFADCYYREGGVSTPNGEPVSGALNVELDEDYFDGDARGYGGATDTHSDVHLWYHGTIPATLTYSSGFDGAERATSDWYVDDAIASGLFSGRETSGYNLSRICDYSIEQPSVSAQTSSIGSSITPDTWQQDDDPYFYWDAPESGLPLFGYSYALDAQPDDSLNTSRTYVQYSSGALSNGVHTFYVKAKNAAGWGPTGSFTIRVDDPPQAPNVSAMTSSGGTSIAANTWQQDDDPYFFWNAPQSNAPVLGYSYALDGQPDDSVDTIGRSAQYSSGAISNGTHTFYVKAKTAVGWGATGSFTIRVDDAPPVLVSASVTGASDHDGNTQTLDTPTIKASLDVTDSSSVAEMRFSSDGVTWDSWRTYSTSTNVNATPAAFAAATSNTVHLYGQFRDIAGNASQTHALGTMQLVPASIPDQALRGVVMSEVSRTGGVIYTAELGGVSDFEAIGMGIVDLTGLESMASLHCLYLGDNQISDLTPLAGLTCLYWLDLSANQISDLTALAGLTLLRDLFLEGNQISDLTSLAGLTYLEYLVLDDNQISDLAPLAGLTQLNCLFFSSNQVSSLTPLSGLTYLDMLSLNDNQISDLTPLAGNLSLYSLSLSSNQISDLAPLAGLTELCQLWLNNNQISDLTPLNVLGKLEWVEACDNQISELPCLDDLTQLGFLVLNNNQISNLMPVSSLTGLSYLSLNRNQINDLTPLAALTQPFSLELSNNQINDLTPLSDLTQLWALELNDNLIFDLAPLANLTQLDELCLNGNQISDLSALVQNTGLGTNPMSWTRELHIERNPLGVSAYQRDLPILAQRSFDVLGYDLAGYASGAVFDDLYGDWVLDVDEPPIAGVVVYLDADDNAVLDWNDDDGDGQWDEGEGERWAITAADGSYVFDYLYPTTGLLPNHVVRQIVPAGYSQVHPEAGGAHRIDLGPGENRAGVDFADQPVMAELVGRHLFYNNSALDGNDSAANAADDAAIDAATVALLPGETPGPMHYSGYSRGINGIMVDVMALAGTPAAEDFIFRVSVPGDPATWMAAPAPANISVRWGEGEGGSDRVTVVWADKAIENQWLETRVKATANTGLVEDDVFSFGHVTGDADGDGRVGLEDFVALKSHFGQADTGIAGGDFDVNGKVDLNDFVILKTNFGTSAAPATAVASPMNLLPSEHQQVATSESPQVDMASSVKRRGSLRRNRSVLRTRKVPKPSMRSSRVPLGHDFDLLASARLRPLG